MRESISDQTQINLINVCKSYTEAGQHRAVLTELNVSFAAGEFVAIQGRSGSGKSTLLNLLAGIDLPDAGEVRLCGQTLNHLSEQQRTLFRRRNIGFIFQAFNLIPTLTVNENLLFPLELKGVAKDTAQVTVNTLLAQFSLAHKARSYPEQLSGGEQQRVAIARAIVHSPAIVLADEPTGNLDIDTERQILELLQRLPQQHNITVIAATHSREIASIADRVLCLESGQLSA